MPELQQPDRSDWEKSWRDYLCQELLPPTLIGTVCGVLCFGLIGWDNPALGNGFAGMLKGALIGIGIGLFGGGVIALLHLWFWARRRLRKWTRGSLFWKAVIFGPLWIVGLIFLVEMLLAWPIGPIVLLLNLAIFFIVWFAIRGRV